MPLGRNYQGVFKIIPGFNLPFNAHSIPSNPSRALRFNVDGTSGSSNNIRVDGVTGTNVWLPHMTSYIPALDSIENVYIVTSSFDAEQGLAGGAAVNVQIKSGTNELHGSAFEYHNDYALKGKNFFIPIGEGNPKQVYNRFGATLGGPIKKDKVFYFISYEGTYDHQFASRLATVPTPLQKKGIFTESTPAGRSGSLWRDEYFNRIVRNRKDFSALVEYVHNNPVRWKVVESAAQYRGSSVNTIYSGDDRFRGWFDLPQPE